MFSGIIEEVGSVVALQKSANNLNITVSCSFLKDIKIDQSIAHNGVCLTVIEKGENSYTVTAIAETLEKTNLGALTKKSRLNLERCLKVTDRFDGHIVQGHVDQTAECTEIKNKKGSYIFTFKYDPDPGNITVEKGSVCVNGVSLTVVNSKKRSFSVAIIPYTFDHTNFKDLKKGDKVNIEFDIIGKYVTKILKKEKKAKN
jgi:riboflavin synthase